MLLNNITLCNLHHSFYSPSVLKGLAHTQAQKSLSAALLNLIENNTFRLFLMFMSLMGDPSTIESRTKYVQFRSKYWDSHLETLSPWSQNRQVLCLFLHLSLFYRTLTWLAGIWLANLPVGEFSYDRPLFST